MDDGAAIPLGERLARSSPPTRTSSTRSSFRAATSAVWRCAGTVNDLAMMGATEPLGLTCGVIIEEGFPIEELAQLQASMRCRVR